MVRLAVMLQKLKVCTIDWQVDGGFSFTGFDSKECQGRWFSRGVVLCGESEFASIPMFFLEIEK